MAKENENSQQTFTVEEARSFIAEQLREANIDTAFLSGSITEENLTTLCQDACNVYARWVSLEAERGLRAGVEPDQVMGLLQQLAFAFVNNAGATRQAFLTLIGSATAAKLDEQEQKQQEPQTATAKPSWYEVLENTTKEND